MKQISLKWAFEPFENHPHFFSKRMFGGLAAYVGDRIVMALFENPGDRSHNGQTYPYDVWNGVLFPTERKLHPLILEEFPNLVPHPVLPKWLYVPMSDEDFESTVITIANYISNEDHRFGCVPAAKKKSLHKRRKK